MGGGGVVGRGGKQTKKQKQQKKTEDLTAAAGLFAVENVFDGEWDQKRRWRQETVKQHRRLLTLIFTALLH